MQRIQASNNVKPHKNYGGVIFLAREAKYNDVMLNYNFSIAIT